MRESGVGTAPAWMAMSCRWAAGRRIGNVIMSAINLSTVRDTVVSAFGSLLFSVVLVGAAVIPAQTAIAATLGL